MRSFEERGARGEDSFAGVGFGRSSSEADEDIVQFLLGSAAGWRTSLRQQGVPPFPFPPKGEKPGREGSPHAEATMRGQQTTLARNRCIRLPPQEGCRPLVYPLLGFMNLPLVGCQ